jgi:hypothetical protein
MKVKDQFLEFSTFNLHNDIQVGFWEDKWFGNVPLKDQYPCLYNITRKKHLSIASGFSSVPLNITFRRALVGDKLLKWNELVARIAFVQLDDRQDSIKWSLSKQGSFNVQSMYKNLVNQIHLSSNKELWKLKLPLKIKIFMWFLLKGVILTKDNLLKIHWRGDHRCCFLTITKIQHLFFDCHVARYVWRIFTMAFGLRPPKDIADFCGVWLNQVDQRIRSQICVGISASFWSIWLCRNDVTFDGKILYSYLQVIFRATY